MTILPGVTIGADTVIGAGSVVTKDLPAGVLAVGNPCKVVRAFNQQDCEFTTESWLFPRIMLAKMLISQILVRILCLLATNLVAFF